MLGIAVTVQTAVVIDDRKSEHHCARPEIETISLLLGMGCGPDVRAPCVIICER